MPKNFEPKVRIGFTQSPERYKEFFVWKIYFDPKCCFGQKKLKIDGTFKNCPWGYGTIYAKVQNFLGLYNFFKRIFPLICSLLRKSALLTMLPHSCHHETENVSLKSGNGWRNEKKSHTKQFPWNFVWHVECSFANPSHEKSGKNEAESIKIRKGQKNCTFFKKII